MLETLIKFNISSSYEQYESYNKNIITLSLLATVRGYLVAYHFETHNAPFKLPQRNESSDAR